MAHHVIEDHVFVAVLARGQEVFVINVQSVTITMSGHGLRHFDIQGFSESQPTRETWRKPRSKKRKVKVKK